MKTFSEIETELFAQGFHAVAGVDEAGRGPLAGPVVAAAVIFPPGCEIDGITDSKKVPEARRGVLARLVYEKALSVGIGIADHEEIDRINVLRASITAMHRAVEALSIRPGFLLIDGNRFDHPVLPFRTVVQGDTHCFTVAAASLIAKTHRDALMEELDRTYPQYGFARHKGYATRDHVEALRRHGFSPVHRRTFLVKELSGQLTIF